MRLTQTTNISVASLIDTASHIFPGGGVGPSDVTLREMSPIVIARAQGAYIETVDGRSLVDFVMGGSAMILGHSHPSVAAALAAHIPKGTHYYQILHEKAVHFAELLVAAIPCAEQVILTSTGSDAINQSIRIARTYKGCERIVRFGGAYHGTNDVALVGMSSTAGSNTRSADAAGIPTAAVDKVSVLPYGDLAVLSLHLQRYGVETAAVLLDPLQRWLCPDPKFLLGVQDICRQHGVLLILDEVVSGFRLAYGGAQSYFELEPDIAAYGKIIGGGLPLGAVAASREIMQAADSRTRSGQELVATSGTFNGNVLSCVAGIATLEELAKPGVYAALAEKGETVRAGMCEIFERHDIPVIAGGVSSFWQPTFAAEEPCTYEEVLRSDLERRKSLDQELVRRGFLVLPSGRRSLSIAHGQREIGNFLSVLDDICREKKV